LKTGTQFEEMVCKELEGRTENKFAI
jgi:hypothetical protein